ncbi:hypothetical protein [Hyphomicrobium sp.]|uniref:hypothetical protein n=1 Tax=Hyphomicrobium sp. TaxID=82 RepID=UPI001DE78B49|nr:hypothetical protein [Hyphomicrobium sp.]MBY0560478.1 hypothetical protein [Hyphomicrobium sp.]
MAKSLLFPQSENLSLDDLAKLADAYELACNELVEHHGFTPEQLAEVLEPMTSALLALQRSGPHDEPQLGRYAASRALAEH